MMDEINFELNWNDLKGKILHLGKAKLKTVTIKLLAKSNDKL